MFKLFCCAALLVSVFALPTAAQNPAQMVPNFSDMSNMGGPGFPASTAPVDPARARMEKQAMLLESQSRQAALRQDTNKLLALATELKQNVDRTGPNILSMDVVKKAQEIEKLAKSVKEKMKGE